MLTPETRDVTCWALLLSLDLEIGSCFRVSISSLIAEFYLVDRGLRHRLPFIEYVS